jgi:hypothetical protein
MEINTKDLESTNVKPKKAIKSKKPIAMNEKPQPIQKEKQQIETFNNNHFIGYLPMELHENFKNMAIKGMSIISGNKAKILQYKLLGSEYVNHYLNKYLMIDALAMTNDHIKFGLVYAVNVFETMAIDLQQSENKLSNNTDNIITTSLQPEVPTEKQSKNNKNDPMLGLNPM